MNEPTKDEIAELKAYVEGVLHGYVCMEHVGVCKKCGKREDLRGGLCFGCSVPKCIRETCPFERLVYCGQGRTQIWANYIYHGLKGELYCDRDQGVCSDQEYVVALEKWSSLSENKTET